MLKALGIGKQKTPKEEDLKKAQDQQQQRQQWRRDLNRLQAIVNRLKDTYTDNKGGFAVNRYEEIKKMIKTAVQNYKDVSQQIKEEKIGGQLHKAEGLSKTGSEPKQGGLMARLKMSAQNFAEHDAEEPVKDFAAMSLKELQAEVETMRKDILQLKGDYYAVRDRLEWLGKEYESSKKFNPTQRYQELKNMVKVVTRGGDVPSARKVMKK